MSFRASIPGNRSPILVRARQRPLILDAHPVGGHQFLRQFHLLAVFERERKCGEARASYGAALGIFDALKERGALSAEYAETPHKLRKAMAGCK